MAAIFGHRERKENENVQKEETWQRYLDIGKEKRMRMSKTRR